MKAQTLTKETILNLGIQDRGFPEFNIGDKIEVSQIVKEGEKERIQKFTGTVIAMHTKGIGSTFTVRKIGAASIGVERIYPYYSPVIDSIKLVQQGKIRRAKLYYLRDRIGKAAQVKPKVTRTGRKKKAAKPKKTEKVEKVGE
ncbi:50S ribosomal protein L19 [Candidatus Dependentiae bacterium]